MDKANITYKLVKLKQKSVDAFSLSFEFLKAVWKNVEGDSTKRLYRL